MSEPKSLNAGDSLSWVVDQGDYLSADGWALSYSVASDEDVYIVEGASVVADGDDYTITVGASVTEAWIAGDYRLIGYVTKTDERVVIYDQPFRVNPNITQLADRRSNAKQMLDAVEAMMIGKASLDQQSMSLNGRSLTRYTWAELAPIRDRLKREVKRERATNGRVLVRFK